MKHSIHSLALLGGTPIFASPLPVGQINIPQWERFREKAGGVFERRYYTNYGALAVELEEKLCRLFQTRHCLAVTNATIGLSILCRALGLVPGDKVIVPAFTFAATVQALTWAGLEPVFCDVDAQSHCITPETVAPCLSVLGTAAILGVHLWGNACDIDGLARIARDCGLRVFYDAAHAVGCTRHGKSIGGFGAGEVFSMHATKVLSSTEGGCIAVDDDDLAERIRNIRSEYGRRRHVPVPVTANGRFSEMQAAFGLLSLEDFPENCANNERRLRLYVEGLRDVPGIRFLLPTPGERHNFQYVVLEIDEARFGLSRDALVRVLEAENILARRYFVPGMHRCVPYVTQFPQYVDALPVTDALCEKVMQLPSGQRVTDGDIAAICELICFIRIHANKIKAALPV
ncbi:MAG: aminotransferase class I/II-fold pyridoxal phosphate-dependent enzyme [Deltaproteobacteria bacterium]|jgi:dTDP-4-amino-4,6-dideoxygalactose transaminase|nr:aminotransferase class I/II-fold pyridoxal phosphate-dependent enzyme [Deltaproteobacteria bacterium]